jgi:hypothetical protein
MKKNGFLEDRHLMHFMKIGKLPVSDMSILFFSELCDAGRGQLCFKSRHNKVCTEYRVGIFGSFMPMH